MMASNYNNIFILVMVVLVIAAALTLFNLFKNNSVNQASASNFVIEDLNSKYPGADIGVVNITRITNPNGNSYFEIKARVTQNQSSPCPLLMHITYDYPVQNFVPQPPEVITNNCQICNEPFCVVTFKEEAVIASHTLPGTSQVQNYIATSINATYRANENLDYWTIDWTSSTEPTGFEVNIAKNNTILNITTIPSGMH